MRGENAALATRQKGFKSLRAIGVSRCLGRQLMMAQMSNQAEDTRSGEQIAAHLA